MSSRSLPGFGAPAVGFDAPFDMLSACHERVERSLQLLQRLRRYLREQGVDDQARLAARDVLRYFDIAAPLHHQDEELHVFPLLQALGDAPLTTLVERLQRDHAAMTADWHVAREPLQALADGRINRFDLAQEAALETFVARYDDHIQAEESTAYPEARARLQPEQLLAMGQEMARRRGAR